MYEFQSESTLYNFPECQGTHCWLLVALSDSNGIRTHNQLVSKRTLNHLAKLADRKSHLHSSYEVR